MSKKLQKSLSECLSNIKTPNKQILLSSKTLSTSTNWMLRGCKHPKTPSISAPRQENEEEQQENDHAATLSDVDQFIFENFRSLYQKEFEENNVKNGLKDKAKEKHAGPFLSPRLLDPPPQNLCSSNRFFVKPGSSSSLVKESRRAIVDFSWDSSSFSEGSTSEERRCIKGKGSGSFSDNDSPSDRFEGRAKAAPDDFITILTYSSSPYHDFRRSMQEMVQARMEDDGKVDWEFMQELLFCYLDLNNKKSFRFILGAFVDLIVDLRENYGSPKPEKSKM